MVHADEVEERGDAQPGERDPKGGVDLVGRHGRLVRRTALVSSLTLVSRILGYAREMLSAALFGDRSGIYDAFITAWRVPNLFRRFLGEGAISTSFQTALTRVDGDHGEAAGKRLFGETLRLLFGLLVGIALVVMGAVWLMPDTLPGTDWRWLGADPGAVRELTVRVMPFVVLVCLAALVSGALQVRGWFGAPSWAPAAMNVAWIAALLFVAAMYGWHGATPDVDGGARHLAMARTLAWGVLASGVVQIAVQLPALKHAGFVGRGAPLPTGAPRAWDVVRKAAPLALGAAVYQVNVMVDGLMAEGLLSDGGPTLHYYANRVQQFPLALIAIAATSAVFPALQAFGHEKRRVELRRLHDRTHLAIAAVALPASFGLFALARPVVAVSFERGAFGAEGVDRTTAALAVLCLAILPAGATGLVARTYYALGDFVTPVKVSIVMLVTNALLNVLFLVGFDMDVDGLALATALTSWGNLAILLPGLRRRHGLPSAEGGAAASLARMVAASLACGAAAFAVERGLAPIVGPALALLLAIGAGGATYFFAARALGVREVEEAWAKVRRRRRRRQ